jgi:hypothetical protein
MYCRTAWIDSIREKVEAKTRQCSTLSRREVIAAVGGGALGLMGLELAAGCGGGGDSDIIRTQLISNRSGLLRPQQQCLEWCWAACAEFVVRSFGKTTIYPLGFPITQAFFAVEVWGQGALGNPQCLPSANLENIAFVMTGDFADDNGNAKISLHGTSVYGVPTAPVAAKLVQLVQNNRPFIFGSYQPPHAFVVYGVEWREDKAGNVKGINRVYLLDPFPPAWYLLLQGYIPDYSSYDFKGLIGQFDAAGVVWTDIV